MSERGQANRRDHPRSELLAQVQVRRELEVHIMPAFNISGGGVFVQGEPTDYPELQPGTELELVIFDADDPSRDDVSVRAAVARTEQRPGLAHGFGLRFVGIDHVAWQALQRLISRKSA